MFYAVKIMAPTLSHSQAVLPNSGTLVLDRIDRHDEGFEIFVCTNQPAICPLCQHISSAQHSGYTRRLGDLPWQGLSVRIWLSVHRYRCRNHECTRKIFCQRVPGVARAYSRRTERLAEIVTVIGYVAGGLPGARLLERLSIQTSDDTVRRLVRMNGPASQNQRDQPPIRVLGVDDWAWRKHQTYGTILVDLERHRVADLLPDRSAESLTLWLEKHPTVEVVARDRGGVYAEGASKGAPSAVQVADRFHLVLNLSSAIERVLEERSRELILPSIAPPAEVETHVPIAEKAAQLSTQQTLQLQRRQRRLERYQQVIELREKGYSQMAISAELNIERKTIRRWLRGGEFPERKPPSGRRQKVADFADYLHQRWNEGCHNATRLFHEISTRGYKGSRVMVAKFVATWRPTGRQLAKPTMPERIAPKHAAILTARAPDKLSEDQQTLLDRLMINCPDIIQLRFLAQGFRDAIKGHDGAVIQQWINTAKHCEFGPLVRFGYGLQKDILAVTAAVEMNWSSGQVEGQVNRLKTIKRQMYGRAGFDLLRARVLPCLQLGMANNHAP
jgi:transposase